MSLLNPILNAFGAEVTGKVVAVYQEKIQLPSKQWADQVSVTVANCQAGNQFMTLHYGPGALGDDNVLGFNFQNLANAARMTEQLTQYMNSVSGHVTLGFDEKSRVIHKTTFWGYNWSCGRNLDNVGGGIGSATPSSPQGQAVQPNNKPANPLGRFGGF